MRVPLSWLRDYVSLDVSHDELADRLTLGGLEVSAIDHVGQNWPADKILVGEVVSVRQHPNADNLTLVTVDYGKAEPLEVASHPPY